MIAVLDYGIGNLRSAQKALEHLGAEARLVTEAGQADGARGVVLPGVGAFGACARALRESGLDAVALGALDAGVPFLGVCVGFQLLFEASEEDPEVRGLGVLAGTVRRLDGSVKLPQMQWNETRVAPGRSPAMLAPFSAPPWFYYVHSYAPAPEGPARSAVAAVCDYGGEVVAAIEDGNCWGTQFHPEKSGRAGLSLLRAFLERCEGAGGGD